MMLTRKITALVCALIWAAPAVGQQTIELPFEQARVIAAQAAQGGEPGLAIDLARALLKADPDDRVAHLVLASALPQVGQAKAGRQAGQRAFALSTTPIQKYEAARQVALAAANEGRFTLSTLWLRRALIHAPNDTETQRTLEDARQVARINPWSTSLSFSLTPSGNVNGGSSSQLLTFDGLPFFGVNSPDAQALSGIVGRFGINVSYRLRETAQDRVQLAFSYDASRVWLSSEAQEQSPNSRNSDFSSDVASVSLSYDRLLGKALGSVGVSIGQVRYAGDPYYDFGRVTLSYTRPLENGHTIYLSGFTEFQDSADGPSRDVTRNGARATYALALPQGDRLSGTLGYTKADSDRINQTSTEWSFEARWTPERRIGPAQVSLSAGITKLDYPEYAIFVVIPDGREDTTRSIGLDITFPDVQFAGFSPVISLSRSSSKSNISRFTRDTNQIGFNIRSSF